MRVLRFAMRVSLAVALAASFPLVAPLASAQRVAANRTVQGKVVNKSDAPLKGAVVHLKDVRSLAQKSFITDTDGTYRFGQLNANSDYEVWAESDGKKSAVKTISSFDSKNSFTFQLKIEK